MPPSRRNDGGVAMGDVGEGPSLSSDTLNPKRFRV